MDEGVVEVCLAHIGPEAIDLFKGSGRVEGERVGAEADDGAVSLVETPEFEMAVAFPGVVELVAASESGEDGAWVLGERVEEEAVSYDDYCLVW